MNTMSKHHHRGGYILIEALIYAILLALLLVVLVSSTLRVGEAYVKGKNLRKVNEVGSLAMDRMVREIRKATDASLPTPGDASRLQITTTPTFAELVRADGAVSHWDFEEEDGPVIDQLAGYHGTPINAGQERGVVAQVGNGYRFNDQAHDEVNFVDDAFSTHNEGTIEVVFKADLPVTQSGSGYTPLFTLSDEADINSALFLGINENENRVLVAKRHGGFVSQDVWFRGDTVLKKKNYYHVAMTTNNTDGKTRLYVNGEEDVNGSGSYLYLGSVGETNNDDTQWFVDFPTLHNYAAGSFIDPAEHTSFKGVIDEIAIYDKPLDEATVKTHYDAAFQTEDAEVTKELRKNADALTIAVGAGSAEALTASGVVVDDLVFTMLEDGEGNAVGVRIALTVSAGDKDAVKSEATFYGAAVFR